MSHPRISVLVPVYNAGAYLTACLESVLAQDFTDVEILLSDNCSTDDSTAIMAAFAKKSPRLRWWRNAENVGVVGNFNHCLAEAKGEYVKYVLADDKLMRNDSLSQMAAVLDQWPDVSMVGSASVVLDEDSRTLCSRNRFGDSGVYDGKQVIVSCFEVAENLIGEPSTIMFRRAAGAPGFDPRYRQLLDLEFYFRLLERGHFGFLAQPLAAWRQHHDQETQRNRSSGAAVRDELLLFQDFHSKPWMRTARTRQMIFTQHRRLRRYYGAECEAMTSELRQQLGRGWHLIYWARRRFARLFKRQYKPTARLIRQLEQAGTRI